jgi:hypothetical protein
MCLIMLARDRIHMVPFSKQSPVSEYLNLNKREKLALSNQTWRTGHYPLSRWGGCWWALQKFYIGEVERLWVVMKQTGGLHSTLLHV